MHPTDTAVMSHRPESSRKFQDFRTLIRNADSHEEAERIMRRMSPDHIESVCRRLIEERGDDKGDDTGKFGAGSRWNVSRFENDKFCAKYVHTKNRTTLYRKTEDHTRKKYEDVVFDRMDDAIIRFDPMRTWNVLNLLDEIRETGEISI